MRFSEAIHQKPSEQIQLMLRRHPITFVPKFFLFVVLLIVPFLFPIIFPASIRNDPFWGTVLILLGSAYFLFILVLFLEQFVDYYLDLWIVTNERIIDINQVGLFKRTVAELDLKKIQDVSSDITGFFATFFNYGDVGIQSAGATQKFGFHKVPKPHEVRTQVLKLAEKK